MPDPRTAVASHPRLIVASAVALVAVVIGVVVMLPGGQLIGPQVPGYLELDDPRVRAALADASTQDEFLGGLAAVILDEYPSPEDWWTTTRRAFERPAARELWDRSRQVRFGNYPPFTVPEDPTWAEDPNRDLKWLRDYHSLAWLRIPARAYIETGDTRYRDQVRHYLLDWIADNPRRDPPSVRSWFDGAVGYRTDLMVELYAPILAEALTPRELEALLESLELHGRLLRGYLSRPGLAGHNHTLFHALSLYNLAVAFPVLREAESWRTAARERVSTLMPEMVALDDGVSLEQAASYHLLAIQLFARAHTYLSRFDDGLQVAELQALEGMTGFAALLLTPTHEFPAIGDTPYGADGWRRLASIRASGLSHPFTDFVLTHGREGIRPPEANFFVQGGYAIIRPEYSSGAAWADDLQLIVDTSARERVHGHHDTMNVLLSAFGHSLLIDSGGPYAYGDEGRAAFLGPSAHNVVVADDGAAEPGPVSDLVETDGPEQAVVAGTYQVSPAVQDRRIVILRKPDLLVIVDRLEALDGMRHRYRLLYHLPPGALVEGHRLSGIVRAGSAGMGFGVGSSGSAWMRVIEGQRDPLLGWVTEGHRRRRPAPVITVEQVGQQAWYVTAIAPAHAEDAVVPEVRVTHRGDELLIVVGRGPRTDRFRVGSDGAVSIERRHG